MTTALRAVAAVSDTPPEPVSRANDNGAAGVDAVAARFEAALRLADDPVRIRSVIAPFVGDEPILVGTLSGLAAARAAAGAEAPAHEVLRALAAAQGIEPTDKMRWTQPGTARSFLKEAGKLGSSGSSFANGYDGTLFVNASCAHLAAWLGDIMTPEAAVRFALDGIALHEVGHIVEHRRKHRLPEKLFAAVKRYLDEEQKIGLRYAMSWHSRECYADAIMAVGLITAGHPLDAVRRFLAVEHARAFDVNSRAVMARDEFWSKYPLWPGTYSTLGVTMRILRDAAAAAPGTPADRLVGLAHRAARRGALPADALPAFLGGKFPDWLEDLDPTGEARRARLRVERRNAQDAVVPLRLESFHGVSDGTGLMLRLVALRAALGPDARFSEEDFTSALKVHSDVWVKQVIGDQSPKPVERRPMPSSYRAPGRPAAPVQESIAPFFRGPGKDVRKAEAPLSPFLPSAPAPRPEPPVVEPLPIPESAAQPLAWDFDDALARRIEALTRSAVDPARMQRLMAPFVPSHPLLIITVPGLSAARAVVGPDADAPALLTALAGLQGIDPADAPWLKPESARSLLKDAARCLGAGSYANIQRRVMYIDVTRVGTMTAWLNTAMPLETAVQNGIDSILFHELGHHVEELSGWKLSRTKEFTVLPRRAERANGTAVDPRQVMYRHAEECYADAFKVLAALAAGIPHDVTAMSIYSLFARLFEKDSVERIGTSPMFQKDPWQGIYCSAGVAMLALRAGIRPGDGLDKVARTALRCARRGALSFDAVLQVADGAPPEWLDDLYPTPAFRDLMKEHLRVRNEEAETVAWSDELLAGLTDPTDRLMRLISVWGALGMRRRFPWSDLKAVLRREVLAWSDQVLGDALRAPPRPVPPRRPPPPTPDDSLFDFTALDRTLCASLPAVCKPVGHVDGEEHFADMFADLPGADRKLAPETESRAVAEFLESLLQDDGP